MDMKQIEKRIREIYQEMFDANYNSGAPMIPPHTHNGIDNLKLPSTGGGTPGGTNKSVQFNNNGVFGGDPGFFEYDVDTGILSVDIITEIPASNSDFNLFTTGTGAINIFSENDGGGDISIFTGNNPSNTNSGAISINTGSSGQSSNIEIITGDANAIGSTTGDILLESGGVSGGDSLAGRIRILGGNINSGNNSTAGSIQIRAGLSSGTGAGIQNVTIDGGFRQGTGDAGAVFINGGAGLSGNVVGGQVVITGGSGNGSGLAGDVSIVGGTGGVFAGGGNVLITVGVNASGNSPGNFSITRPTITPDFGGGSGVVFLAKDRDDPSSDPVSGIILYVDAGGNLMARGSAGTITTIALA